MVAVPFRYGTQGNSREEGIGKVWASEVDAEMKSLQTMKTTKGMKRKATSKTPNRIR